MSPSSSEDSSDSGNVAHVTNIGPTVERIQVRSHSYHHLSTSPPLRLQQLTMSAVSTGSELLERTRTKALVYRLAAIGGD